MAPFDPGVPSGALKLQCNPNVRGENNKTANYSCSGECLIGHINNFISCSCVEPIVGLKGGAVSG